MDVEVVIAAVIALVTVTAALFSSQTELRRRRRTEAANDALLAMTDPTLARLAPAELFAELVARLRRSLDADGAVLVVGGVTRATDGRPVEPALAARVTDGGDVVLLADGAGGGGSRSFAGAPVLVEGQVVGAVGVVAARRAAFSAVDVNLVRRVADRCGRALDRERFDERERLLREDVAETEHRVRTLVEAAPVGMVEATLEGEAARWNRAAAELLSWPRWLVGMPAPGPLPEETHDAVVAAAGGRRTEGIAVAAERGGTRSVQLVASASPITDREGNVEGVLVLLDDVTDRQQLEQHVRQAQRLGALARLAGGVAHDFNNLLTVIRGYGEVLRKTMPSGDERIEDIDAILDAAGRAADLTKQLLTIGRRPAMEPEVLDLHRHVEDLAPVLERLVDDDVDLRVVTGAAAGPGQVRVDPGGLDQALMNLVINARDAMPGGGRIMVEARNVELRSRGASLAGVTAGRYVLVTVADTGQGMPPDVVEHCFDPFFTTKGRGKGTGLGLALVYGTATQAGGHATVESELGRGTTFRMWLPEVTERAAPVRTGRPARRRRTPFSSQCRILLVEDEAPVRTLARVTLEEAGHEVLEAASAEEALARVDADPEPIDVLVSDVVLGGMTGDQLAAGLRRKQPALRVVLMSGFTEQALVVEPDAFLAKPFPFDELVAVVARVVADQGSKR